jgi:protein-ribulosamine 3-kinase
VKRADEPWGTIGRYIAEATDEPFQPHPPSGIGGGCINTTVKLSDGRRDFFVKLNAVDLLWMFSAEAEGLGELAGSRSIRVPEPVCHGSVGEQAYLVMEYVPMGRPGPAAAETAGRQLAAMHRCGRDAFGWHRDNTIGSTPQSNASSRRWQDFWRDRRLGFQLELAGRNGYSALLGPGEKLLAGLAVLLDHAPPPSLLHGDLWGGNLGYDVDGEPLIFDPAVYYGDREADLAMTELFGGFSGHFYAAYDEAWPLPEGYRVRKTLYNLYHILNHANMFGGGYVAQARGMMDRLLAEIG